MFDFSDHAGVYWGASVVGQSPSPTSFQPGGAYDQFEQRAGKKMAIIEWGQSWKMDGSYQGFYAPWFDRVRAHGSIPLLSWSSMKWPGGPDQPEFRLNTIYNGKHDTYLRQWARDAKAWGHPFFLRFDWEMNGDWQFPWAEQINGNQAGDYIKAWKHVHDIFTQTGATNVTWVWCPNISSETTVPMASLYPGDAYVDWIGLDGYNKESTWMSFNTVFSGSGIDWLGNSYQEVLAVAPNKPLLIGETASIEAGDGGESKAAWITDALLTQLPQSFPRVKAIVWFNDNDGDAAQTFPIESSAAATAAFAQGIGSSYYATNHFAKLDSSPIPPLRQ